MRMERMRWTERRTNAEVLTQVGEVRNKITALKKKRLELTSLRNRKELDHIINKRTMVRRKFAGRPRNSYISQLKKDLGLNTYVKLKQLTEDREE